MLTPTDARLMTWERVGQIYDAALAVKLTAMGLFRLITTLYYPWYLLTYLALRLLVQPDKSSKMKLEKAHTWIGAAVVEHTCS